MLHLLDNTSLGNGFDSAAFQISLNGSLFDSEFFNDLASAQAFFSHSVIAIQLLAGRNNVQLSLTETMSIAGGFAFNYAADAVTATPLPASWTMMLAVLVGFGFVAYRRQKHNCALLAA